MCPAARGLGSDGVGVRGRHAPGDETVIDMDEAHWRRIEGLVGERKSPSQKKQEEPEGSSQCCAWCERVALPVFVCEDGLDLVA